MSSRRRRSKRRLKRQLGAGVIPRMRPDRSFRARGVLRRWGLTPATAYAVGAIRHPERPAIIDEWGAESFLDVHLRTDAIAHSMRSAGIGRGDIVAIMCAGHRGLIEASVATSKLAANVIFLHPGTSVEELRRTILVAQPSMLICDEQHEETLAAVECPGALRVAWSEPGRESRRATLEDLAARAGSVSLEGPEAGALSRFALAPAGASQQRRTVRCSLMIPSVVNSRIPLRPREATLIAAPIIEPWGFAHLTLAMRLASTVVLRRRFDPVETLAAVQRHDVTALALLPSMLARIVTLPRETLAWYPAALRVIAVMGPALPCEVAIPAIERFGDVLYNLPGRPMLRLDGHWPLGHARPIIAAPVQASMARGTAPGVS